MSLGASAVLEHKTPYQGYPYVSPRVVDAPSLGPEEIAALAKWQNLPRRQLGAGKNDAGSSGEPVADAVPSPSGSKQDAVEDRPTIYIDVLENNNSGVSQTVENAEQRSGQAGSSRHPFASGSKRDTDPEPVIYIDLPDSNGSGVSQTRQEESEPAYVQETIFYDQFKDRRINLPRDSDSEGEVSSPGSSRPPVPTTLNLTSPGSSGYSSFTANSSIPPFLNKEAYVYGRQPTPDDGFPLSPIPVSDFPAPPPPYQEVEQQPPKEDQEVVEPPRTQVITPSSPTITLDGSRKLITCQHCNMTVPTLVIMEAGLMTHLLALFLFILIFPFAVLVYCMDCCKYKNHYCPGCNKRVGYESPLICGSGMTSNPFHATPSYRNLKLGVEVVHVHGCTHDPRYPTRDSRVVLNEQHIDGDG